jgi:hypothetical protein
VVSEHPPRVCEEETQALRRAMRARRLEEAKSVAGGGAPPRANPDKSGRTLRRIHEYVEVAQLASGETVMRCCKCAHVLGPANENYKRGAAYRVVELERWLDIPLPNGGQFLAQFHEYFCPGCATQIAVETHCPSLEAQAEPVWDIRLDVDEGAVEAGDQPLREAAFGKRRLAAG